MKSIEHILAMPRYEVLRELQSLVKKPWYWKIVNWATEDLRNLLVFHWAQATFATKK